MKNHKSKCDFVGGRGLSADSLEKVMGALYYKGELKSRAGLDDEDVIRGHDAKDDEEAKEMTHSNGPNQVSRSNSNLKD